MIRTDADEYFIEPLERGTQELEHQGRVHVVYRRSALLQPPADPPGDDDDLPPGRPVTMFCTCVAVSWFHSIRFC